MKIENKQGISLIVLIVTIAVMIVLATAIITSITTTTTDADKATFMSELVELEDALNVYYVINETLPSASSSYTKEQVKDLVASSNRSIFEQELHLNADDGASVQFYVLDLSVLEVDNSKSKESGALGENDKFFFSFPNLNVYYLYGVETDNTVYFANTSRLTNMADIAQQSTTTDTPVNVTYNQNITLPDTSTTKDTIAPTITYDIATYYENVKVIKFTVSDNVEVSQVKYDYLEKEENGVTMNYYNDVTSFTDEYMLNSAKSVDISSIKSDGRVYLKIPSEVTKITLMVVDTALNKNRIDVSVNSVYTPPTIIDALEILSHPKSYYGAYVDNYTESSGSGVKWKIFYSEGKNIYLIADDYIPYDSIPNSTKDGVSTSNKPNRGETTYTSTAYFDNILDDYIGSASITESKIRNLNSKYFEYLTTNGKTSENNNMKAVAYMLDIKAWEKFKGEKADYAIGGPTSEIFIKSYNQKYPDSQLEYQVRDLEGYSYRNGSSDSWSYSVNSAFETSDPLYVITDYKTKAYVVWLASPSIIHDGDLNGLFGGTLSVSHWNDVYAGFRPVVCLKSNVNLTQVSTDHFNIIK